MLLRQTLLYMPAQILGPLTQVVAAIVWTHWLAPAPYGLLTFLIASQDLVFQLCMAWWTHFTLRYLGALEASQRVAFLRSEASIFALTFVAQIFATLLVLVFLHEPISANLATAAIVCVGTRSLLIHLGERARVQSHIGTYTWGQLAGSVLGLVLAYLAVVLVAATPAAVLWGYAVAQAIGVALMWRRLGIAFGRLLPRKDILAAAFLYGMPLLVAGGLAWMAQNGIRLVVEKMAGADALGLVAVGWGLGQRLAATLALFCITASFPLAVKSWRGDARAEAYRQLNHGGVLLVGLTVPAAIGLSFLAEPFVTLFVAAPFREETIAILPYAAAAGVVRNIRMHIADAVFLLVERPRINTAINFFDAATTLILCLAGLWFGGLRGAVVGCLAASIIIAVGTFVLARRMAGFDFVYRDGCKIAVASALMALGLAIVPWAGFHLSAVARMALEATFGACLYAIAIVALYPTEAKAFVLQAKRRWIAPA